MTSQSNGSQGRGHDRLPNWNPKNGGMLISQPISSCLTNHSELCMSRLLNNQSRRISIYRLQRRPFFGFDSPVSSTPMTSGDPVVVTLQVAMIRIRSCIHNWVTAIVQVNLRQPAPPAKKWRILLQLSITACIPLLVAPSTFGLGRRS